MKKPTKAHYNTIRRTSTLFFADGESAEFYMRGGVCWPVITDRSDTRDFEGYILMCGQNVQTGVIQVFEQKNFVTIESILKDGAIAYQGIGPWLNSIWSRYFARDYYWHQEFQLHKRNLLQIIRSPMVDPKPQFIEVPWIDDQEAQMVVWHYVKTGKVQVEKESRLFEDLNIVKTTDKKSIPSVYALQCALIGLEAFPYRKPFEEAV